MDEAETRFKTATSLILNTAEAENNLGVVYGQQGKSAEAEKLFRQAVENNPQYAQAFVNLGLILAVSRDFRKQTKPFRRPSGLNRTNTKALSLEPWCLFGSATGGGCHGLP